MRLKQRTQFCLSCAVRDIANKKLLHTVLGCNQDKLERFGAQPKRASRKAARACSYLSIERLGEAASSQSRRRVQSGNDYSWLPRKVGKYLPISFAPGIQTQAAAMGGVTSVLRSAGLNPRFPRRFRGFLLCYKCV